MSGRDDNVGNTRNWIAVSVYVLVAIVKTRRLDLLTDLYTILRILDLTLFKKTLLIP